VTLYDFIIAALPGYMPTAKIARSYPQTLMLDMFAMLEAMVGRPR
jgi:hypothetical protein